MYNVITFTVKYPSFDMPFYVAIVSGSQNIDDSLLYNCEIPIATLNRAQIESAAIQKFPVKINILYNNIPTFNIAEQLKEITIKQLKTLDDSGILTNISLPVKSKEHYISMLTRVSYYCTSSFDQYINHIDVDVKYGTIQIKMPIKRNLVKYCKKNKIKISKFVEDAISQAISGSTVTI